MFIHVARSLALLLPVALFTPLAAAAQESDQWRFNLMPRYWLSQERISAVDESNFNLGGLSLTAAPPDANYDFVVTAFYGQDDERKPVGFIGSGVAIRNRDRLDVEGIVRFFPSENNFYVFTGPRMTRIRTDVSGSDNIEEWIGLIEFGAGTWTPITERARFVAGGMVGAGYRYVAEPGTNDRGLSLAFDIHAGVDFRLTDQINLLGRYRSFVTPLRQNDDEFAFQVAHGPEVGVGFSF